MEPDEEASEVCHHYSRLEQVPWDIQKYWQQRYDIFSRYDDGIWMTDDTWFGITPESVAYKIAEHLTPTSGKNILADAFAGAGGNTIAFALSGKWNRVIAIEKDAQIMACARQNAKVYGVDDQIEWYTGDCFEVLKSLSEDVRESCVIFASPPWGGPGYRSAEVFNLSTMQPYSLRQLYEGLAETSKDLVLYLPRTSDLRQIASLVPAQDKVKTVHYCIRGASKALCVFLGETSTGVSLSGLDQ